MPRYPPGWAAARPAGPSWPADRSFAREGGEARITQTGAYSQDGPALHVEHGRHLAQSLQHGIIVDDDQGRLAIDAGQRLGQLAREIEIIALPIAGEILTARLDRAVAVDDAGAAD